MKCPQCGHGYNGKSGSDNTTGIVIYSGVVAVVIFGFIFSLFAVAGILTVMAK